MTSETRRRAVQAARGETPFDLLLTHARIIDMATGEIREADIGIVGELIASVHPRGSRTDAHEIQDLNNQYVSPGLMDTHVHLESSHLLPARYAEIVLAQGTTAVFWDPHELANVLGIEGVRFAIEASRNLPLQVMVAAPSSVPSTPGLEMSGADFAGQEMQTLLSWPDVRGVAEVMDMHGVLNGSPRMLEIMQAGLESGKLIEGHARGLSGADLQAYLAAGVTSDHELTSADDALEKLRAGLTLEIRGSHPYLLPDIVNALKTLPHLSSQITVCTDDVPPDILLEKGGIIALLNLLIGHGLAATDALRFATLNAAIRLQRNDLGLIAAGRRADLVVFDSLQKLTARQVYVAGKEIARNGKMLTSLPDTPLTLPRDTVQLPAPGVDDFQMRIANAHHGVARLRHISGARFTRWGETEVQVRNGRVQIPSGFSLIWVQHRHARHAAKPQMALLEGWGELRGAIATSYSHDSHNLVVLGRDPEEMALAARALIQSGGGMALAQHGQVIAHVAMPIAGMLSELPADELARQFKALRDRSSLIADWEPPYRVFKAIEGTCLACNAGPHLTDLGLTDGSTREIVDPLISYRETPDITS
ncbi:adenine deaminase [Enterobacter cancerogenus]|uniref:adenine deaminase n=1 Tax=Enterobacter cancerogenus TaxID=69218 RepID=UPI000C9C0CF5|nr:adenine deaminase C-terminal domain-containing protein [Enterobacter cancerogenus]MDT7008692.1 adenine deaminase C-terminal domain-containing protein [Enterobacter cancerogenus]MRG32048.1 amidohydrolase family protein [Enterobacter cancerogenus]PNF10203.1 adenine deaminase [Enterobacter cancerogenus]QGG07508.1 amidohydrolase family protein [Enterobacter cancerogenus]QZY35488.1 amidohydrolase family protein [Enterobacter cancerogenus]